MANSRSIIGDSPGRPEADFYPTPPDATQALLDRETFDGTIWEPACGDGAIVKVLLGNGHQLNRLMYSDLIDRNYGIGGIDFLTSGLDAANIITNPPFSLATEFMEVGLRKTSKKLALFGKLAFLEGRRRKTIFESSPLKSVYVFSYRLKMGREGAVYKNSSMMAHAWFVWDHDYTGKPTIEWI